MPVTLAVLLALAVPVRAKETYAADERTVKLVEYFIKTDTSQLKEDLIPTFMRVLPETLPKRLREPARAKQLELALLKKLAEQQKRPPIRRAGMEPVTRCEKKEGTDRLAHTLRQMGFIQIDQDEEDWLMGKTKCTECELQEEFSLTIVMVEPKKKGDPWVKYLFLHAKDPLMALVGQYRRGASATGTDFFGVGFFGACR